MTQNEVMSDAKQNQKKTKKNEKSEKYYFLVKQLRLFCFSCTIGNARQNSNKKNISKVCDGRKNPSHTFASLASLAQLVRERVAVNDKVAGSIPAGSVDFKTYQP